MNEPIPFAITLYLYPIEHVRAALPEDWSTATGKYKDQLFDLEAAIQKIDGVQEAEFGHTNYVKIESDAETFQDAQTEYTEIEQKVRKAIVEWGEALKTL